MFGCGSAGDIGGTFGALTLAQTRQSVSWSLTSTQQQPHEVNITDWVISQANWFTRKADGSKNRFYLFSIVACVLPDGWRIWLGVDGRCNDGRLSLIVRRLVFCWSRWICGDDGLLPLEAEDGLLHDSDLHPLHNDSDPLSSVLLDKQGVGPGADCFWYVTRLLTTAFVVLHRGKM